MSVNKIELGHEVVRSKGDYVVGRKGTILALDMTARRARVDWYGETKTWVSFDSIESTSIPYKIEPTKFNEEGRRISWPQYIRL